MGLIPQTKTGDCSRCTNRNTNVKKRGKLLLCTFCCNRDDNAKQLKRQREKVSVRSLNNFQREEGIVDSIQELVIDLDRVVSRMVRIGAMGKDHKVQCFTCSRKLDWSKIHCGHFIPRANLRFRFDWTYNLRPQCPTCNVTLYGNLEVFRANLEKERHGIVEWMQEEAREVTSPTRNELKQLLFDYQQRLRLIENKLK